jgi:tetratricopeptide (TPR) repeat protein
MDTLISLDSPEFLSLIQQKIGEDGVSDWAAVHAVQAYQAYTAKGDISAIDRAIELGRISLGNQSKPTRISVGNLNNLGVFLQCRYERTGQIADLDEAIRLVHEAVAVTSANNLDHAIYLSNLSNNLEIRYEQTGQLEDLEEAIETAQRAVAVAAIPGRHPDHASYLNNLSAKLGRRYERTGQVADLDEAIDNIRKALAETSNDIPARATRLSNLGTELGRRYERTGHISDLEDAIANARQAVVATPDDDPERANRLSNLGNKLGRRYERTGQMSDLEDAIETARQSVASTPNEHPNYPACLNNLGNKLASLYRRTRKLTDLTEAIDMARKAVAATPDDHTYRATYLNNLGSKLEIRYEQTGQIGDLDEAIKLALQVVEATSDDDQHLIGYLNNLGNALESRYEQTGLLIDLEEAIMIARKAIAATPDNHTHRAICLSNLGSKLESRYERTMQRADIKEVCSLQLQSWNSIPAPPFERIKAASAVLGLCFQAEILDTAASLAPKVLNLISIVASRNLHRNDLQFIMSHFAEIASRSCAIMLEIGEPKKALEFLDQGRAVLAGQLIDARHDVSQSKRQPARLFETFEAVRIALNATIPIELDVASRRDILDQQRTAAAKFEDLLEEIRHTPGNERFLLGLASDEMQVLAGDETIVVVNITDLRSDAILVSSNAIEVVSLSNTLYAESKQWFSQKYTMRRPELRQENKRYTEFLEWLWKDCVKIIMEKAGLYIRMSGEKLPRIWWIGCDIASSMPFHAAGVHNPNSTETTLCRVVSSYASSFKALAYAKKVSHARAKTCDSILAVSMATTAGNPKLNLRGANKELSGIGKVLGERTERVELFQPDAKKVLEAMQHHSILHCACHGRTDSTDPSNSGLIFEKRSQSGLLLEDHLTIYNISEKNLPKARIAYLSACSTAQNRAGNLVDEAIHVVSGFQIAGFPHVIGCLWPSFDNVCIDMAKGFYSRLFIDGAEQISDEDVARALHGSLMSVRAKLWNQPLKWASFVHYGA